MAAAFTDNEIVELTFVKLDRITVTLNHPARSSSHAESYSRHS
jgi:hypothetical protein